MLINWKIKKIGYKNYKTQNSEIYRVNTTDSLKEIAKLNINRRFDFESNNLL